MLRENFCHDSWNVSFVWDYDGAFEGEDVRGWGWGLGAGGLDGGGDVQGSAAAGCTTALKLVVMVSYVLLCAGRVALPPVGFPKPRRIRLGSGDGGYSSLGCLAIHAGGMSLRGPWWLRGAGWGSSGQTPAPVQPT